MPAAQPRRGLPRRPFVPSSRSGGRQLKEAAGPSAFRVPLPNTSLPPPQHAQTTPTSSFPSSSFSFTLPLSPAAPRPQPGPPPPPQGARVPRTRRFPSAPGNSRCAQRRSAAPRWRTHPSASPRRSLSRSHWFFRSGGAELMASLPL